jgi:hypothetical protein
VIAEGAWFEEIVATGWVTPRAFVFFVAILETVEYDERHVSKFSRRRAISWSCGGDFREY